MANIDCRGSVGDPFIASLEDRPFVKTGNPRNLVMFVARAFFDVR